MLQLNSLFNKKNPKASSNSEMEDITTRLIDETTTLLEKRFQKSLQNAKSGNESIECDSVKQILNELVHAAIANRKMLIGRIEKDIETGRLFDRYYGKMHTINSLTNNAYAQMQRMEVAEEKYLHEKEVYKKVTGKMYVEDAKPNEADPSAVRKRKKLKDLWKAIRSRVGNSASTEHQRSIPDLWSTMYKKKDDIENGGDIKK